MQLRVDSLYCLLLVSGLADVVNNQICSSEVVTT